jgi:hypothetical protein
MYPTTVKFELICACENLATNIDMTELEVMSKICTSNMTYQTTLIQILGGYRQRVRLDACPLS